MKHIFIINPAAGKTDKTAEYTANIQKSCAGLSYEIVVSRGPGDCTRIARESAQTGEEIVITFTPKDTAKEAANGGG